ncbi:MAG: serine/threonine-protein kinase [Bdellovibrionota bacterium]
MANTFEKFGKYVLLEKMASGGMAEIYLAKSPGANGVTKFLAIKRILPQFSDNTEFIDMFKEEAKIAVNLNHGNVVSIYDFGVEKAQFYLVMEYVEGRNLRQIINELKKKDMVFSVEQVVFMIKEVAAGLDHAHRCIDGSTGKPLNITHRDMSPQNIMVSFEGEVKIIDFGIAKAETQIEVTKAGTLKGKFGYMSPEQAEGHPIDLRTDIFSLGIVLWELLANDRLFTSNSEAAILRKIRDCNITPIRKINPTVHPELERIVAKSLTKDKSIRYQTAAAFNRDLNRYLNTQYPDFAPEDFSVFIKNAFSENYTSQKNKLVEYSKVQADSIESTNDSSYDAAFGNSNSGQAVESPDHSYSEIGLTLPSDTNVAPIDLKTLIKEKPSDSGKDYQSGVTKRKTIPGIPSARSTTISGSTGTGVPQYTFSASKVRRHQKSQQNSSSTVAIILTLIFAGGIGLFLYKKPMEGSVAQSSLKYPANKAIPEATMVPRVPGQNESIPGPDPLPNRIKNTGRKQSAVVSIFSEPSEAEIYLDGEFTGHKTPYRFTKLTNQDYQLKLIKQGYLPLEKTFSLTRLVNTLDNKLSLERYGFINLNVIGGGSNPVVEINGKIVDKKPPITMQKVPAGVPITIRVNNEYLNMSAAETITVNENQKKIVELVLKSNQ